MARRLVVVETHPVQYRAPLYRLVNRSPEVSLAVVYGSDFSVRGYRDAEFGQTFAWDTDLLSGYDARFLERAEEGGAASPEEVSGKGMAAALRDLEPDVVLLTGYAARFHRRAFREARRAGCPILFRAETTDHGRRRGAFRRWVRDAYLRSFYSRCSVLLPIGVRSAAHFRRLAPEKPLIESPYCVDDSSFDTEEDHRARHRERVRRELGIGEEETVYLFSGKLVPKKAPDLLIGAARSLPLDLRERAVLVYMGDGTLRGSLDRLAGESPAVQTRFVGFQNQSRLSAFYHAADLLVLPSRWGETWGLVVNEALHHGLPAIVSDQVGCAPDLVVEGMTGDVFRSGSAASLATALERSQALIGDRDVRDRCRRQVSSYSMQRAAEGILQALRRATASRAARPGAGPAA